MNTKIINIISAICIICGLWSCSDDNVSDLRLNGDCKVEALALDNYEGIIDMSSRTVVVRLPDFLDGFVQKDFVSHSFFLIDKG